MRWKAALAMVLLAALAVLLIWYGGSGPVDAPKPRKVFPTFKAEQVEELRLVRSDAAKGTVLLANREGTWRMEQPVACKANNFGVSGLTSAIAECEPEKSADIVRPAKGAALDLAKYGLDRPVAEVTVKMKDPAKTTLSFALGAKVGAGEGAYFLKPGGREEVLVVGKKLPEEVLRGADEYRDRRIFDLASADVDAFEMDVGKGLLSARKESGDKWRLVAPVSDRGNRTKVEALRDKLLDQQLDEFDHEPVDQAKQGLDQPTMRLVLSSQKSGKRQELVVGKVVEGHPGMVFARRADLPFLYRLKQKTLEDLAAAPNDLRDTYLESFSADKLAEIEARSPAGPELVLARDGESWRMTKPKEAAADKSAVEDVGAKLSGLEIKAYVEDAPKDLARYGLDKPELSVTLKLKGEPPPEEKKDEKKDKDEKKSDKDKKAEEKKEEKKLPELKALGELGFGKVCPAGTVPGAEAGARFRFAKRAADGCVFAVPAEAVDKLLSGPLAFRDRTVLKIANKDKAVRLAVARGELKYLAEKKADKWMLTSPVGEEADSGAAGRLIERLADLSAEKVLADGLKGPALAEYGLAPPAAAVDLTVETGADPKTYRLVLGKAASAGGLYAMLPDGELLYELSRQAADELGGELVRRELLEFDRGKAQKVTVERASGELVLVKTGEKWSLEKPAPPAPADKDKAEALVSALAGLKAERIADYAPAALGKYGLAKPAAVVTVELDGGKKAVLQLGDGLDSGARRYVKVPDRALVFVVDKSVAEKLEAPADDLRPKGKDKPGPATEPPKAGAPPAAELDPKALPRVTIKTARGNIVVELFEDQAPNTAACFIELAGSGRYDGLAFHRVIKDFMIQGGCPKGDGTGDFGYKIADEIDADALGLDKLKCKDATFFEFLKSDPQHPCPKAYWDKPVKSWYEKIGYQYAKGRSGHKMVRGMLAMANSGPNTNGSQFFIVTGAAFPHLDGKHTVFGQVVEGLELADKIEPGDKMTSVEVNRKRREKYEVKKL